MESRFQVQLEEGKGDGTRQIWMGQVIIWSE